MLRTSSPEECWVTVAAASAALTKAGDPLNPSNVSKYLTRNADIPQRRSGKFRYVELNALRRHRNTSLYVTDKRQSRDLDGPAPHAEPEPAGDQDDDLPAAGGSAIANTNLEIKQLELRRKLREEAIETGQLVPVDEVRTICLGMLEAYAAELARQEGQLTTKLGREIGLQIRKAHRAARAEAVRRLIEAAGTEMAPTAITEDAAQAA